jgi:integrase
VRRTPWRFVQRIPDGRGGWYNYFRMPGRKRLTLPGLYGSPEFAAAFRAALEGNAPVIMTEIGANRTKAGSLNQLIVSYYKSTAFVDDLSTLTQMARRRIIEKIRIAHGEKSIANLQPQHVAALIDKVTGHAKKNWMKAIRGLMAYAVSTKARTDDPSAGIKLKAPKSTGGFHTWTDQEIEQYRAYWPLGTQQRLVMEFALETASRRSEVVKLGPQHVKHGRIKIARGKGSAGVDIRVTPELQAACEAMPREHLTYIVTAYGKPRTAAGLGNDFARWCDEAGLPSNCRMHGLRKARTRQLVQSGATPHHVMSVTGHKTLAEVQRYADEYNRPEAADEALDLLSRRKARSKGTR